MHGIDIAWKLDMEPYTEWIDVPWREMPSWMRAFTLVVGIAAASVLDHRIGGAAGILIGLGVALAIAIVVPVAWRTIRRSARDHGVPG